MIFKPKNEWPNCPKWLLDADTKNELVNISDEVVTWKCGIWVSGLWRGGTWKSGTWKSGTWVSGTWVSGLWRGGTWKSGLWRGGTWERGVWRGGIWESGIWEFGTWRSGTWRSGTWMGGYDSPFRCLYPPLKNGNWIKFGCEEKKIEEWQQIYDAGHYADLTNEQFDLLKRAFNAIKTM